MSLQVSFVKAKAYTSFIMTCWWYWKFAKLL